MHFCNFLIELWHYNDKKGSLEPVKSIILKMVEAQHPLVHPCIDPQQLIDSGQVSVAENKQQHWDFFNILFSSHGAVHQCEGKAPDLCSWRLSSWKATWLCILIAGPQRRDFPSPLPSQHRLPWNAPTPPNIVFLKPFGISYDYASLPLPLRLEAAFTSC